MECRPVLGYNTEPESKTPFDCLIWSVRLKFAPSRYRALQREYVYQPMGAVVRVSKTCVSMGDCLNQTCIPLPSIEARDRNADVAPGQRPVVEDRP